MTASLLIAASAAIVFVLGTIHLVYTFRTNKFDPRDLALKESMQAVSPVLTRQTTMWKAWVGFNASHSLGAMLFGWVFGYLALLEPALLFRSPGLWGIGLAMLLALAAVGKKYWFSVPNTGIGVSLVLYGAGMVAAFV